MEPADERLDSRRGRLIILGSGETAETMVELHRSVLNAAGPGPGLVLDSSYGFQENVDSITRKTLTFFESNVGRAMTELQWRTPLHATDLDSVLTAIRTARAVYAGPGSPSYTMRVWGGSGFAEAVAALIDAGGTATFSSAAAIALGAVAMPTHEIYRGGADPHWLPGTDTLHRLTGISAALVPHYDLAPKNGTHDTRCCYIGERRMRLLEEQLPEGAHLIGIDEHTALIMELGAGTARVFGRGSVTIRVDGVVDVLPAGSEVPLARLRARRTGAPTATAVSAHPAPRPATEPRTDLLEHTNHIYRSFAAALGDRDAERAATLLLDLEDLIARNAIGWADPEQAQHARRTLRGMVLELAAAATTGLRDPRELLQPLVDALLKERTAARERRDFAAADGMRDALADVGIEVRDSPRGVEWSLQP